MTNHPRYTHIIFIQNMDPLKKLVQIDESFFFFVKKMTHL